MAKKTKVPKKILGFKLSKGTRKDLTKLLRMVTEPDTRTIAVAVASALSAFIAERLAQYEPVKKGSRARSAQAH